MGNTLKPFIAMVLVQVCIAGMIVLSKFALQSGMNPLVLVAYRQMFATVAVAPFAYWSERNRRPQITKSALFLILLSSVTGATANQVLYFLGLKHSTPTIATAISNLVPAATFVLAVLLRQESLGIKTKPGFAKVMGTAVCIGGAMLLTFYHGLTIDIPQSKVHWAYAEKMEETSGGNRGNQILGPLLLTLSTVSWAAWFVIQAKLNDKFPAPYTSNVLMSSMAAIECTIIAVCFEHKLSGWSLKNPIRLAGTLFGGVVCSGIAYCLASWTIQSKGAMFASAFSPFLLILMVIISWAMLHEKLYIGTAVGSILIALGLYTVLWGKTKETKQQEKMSAIKTTRDSNPDNNDLELPGE